MIESILFLREDIYEIHTFESFILTKGEGTWGKADSDLAKEVRDGGHDKGLKESTIKVG